MADTYTADKIAARLQTIGGNENTWGNYLNDEVITYLAAAIADYREKSVAGAANVTLTAAEARSAFLKLTGLLTGDIEVIVPTAEAPYKIWNATTGSYTVTAKTSAGTGIVVTQNTIRDLWCDGTNVIAALTSSLVSLGNLSSVARLVDIAALAVTNGGFIEANGSNFALRVPMVVGSFTPVLRFGATNASSSVATGLYVTFATALGSFGLVHIAVNLTNKNGGSGQTRINAIPIAPLTTSAACSLAPNDGWDFDMGVSALIGTNGEINFYKGPTTAGGSLAGYQNTDVGATASSMTVSTAFRIS